LKKIFYFLIISIAFTGLQVMTASAENCAKAGTPSEVSDCFKRQTVSGDGKDHNEVSLTIGDPRCAVVNDLRDTRCPNYRSTDEGKADTADDNASAHKVGQERWDSAMGGKGKKTMHDDDKIGMKLEHKAVDDKFGNEENEENEEGVSSQGLDLSTEEGRAEFMKRKNAAK
jgi:hypothetical protein